jgi:hypothetical protein
VLRHWWKSLFYAGAFGLILGLLYVILKVFGMGDESALYARSAAILLWAIVGLGHQVYVAVHGRDADERLLAAAYETIRHNLPGPIRSKDPSNSTTSTTPDPAAPSPQNTSHT